MLKRILLVLSAHLAISVVASTAVYADTCWQLSPGGNIVKLRFLAVGPSPNRFLITGVEDVFDDRTVDGSASVGFQEPNTLRIGFTDHGNTGSASHLECNARVILGNGNGTWACWIDAFEISVSGDFVLIPGCVGVPGVAAGPDILGSR
jgi:hypothetical protein